MPALHHSLFLLIATSSTVLASWMVRAPPDEKLTSYRHSQEQPEQRPFELEQKPVTITITKHRTAYSIAYRTVTQTWSAPPPHPTSNLDSCNPAACETCGSWFRCDDGPNCFYCKTLPRECNCVPPAELIRGANEYEASLHADDEDAELEETRGVWQTCVQGSHQHACFVEDEEIMPRLDL